MARKRKTLFPYVAVLLLVIAGLVIFSHLSADNGGDDESLGTSSMTIEYYDGYRCGLAVDGGIVLGKKGSLTMVDNDGKTVWTYTSSRFFEPWTLFDTGKSIIALSPDNDDDDGRVFFEFSYNGNLLSDSFYTEYLVHCVVPVAGGYMVYDREGGYSVKMYDEDYELVWTTTTGINVSPLFGIDDGSGVVFVFTSRDVAKVDYDGEVLWKSTLSTVDTFYDLSAILPIEVIEFIAFVGPSPLTHNDGTYTLNRSVSINAPYVMVMSFVPAGESSGGWPISTDILILFGLLILAYVGYRLVRSKGRGRK